MAHPCYQYKLMLHPAIEACELPMQSDPHSIVSGPALAALCTHVNYDSRLGPFSHFRDDLQAAQSGSDIPSRSREAEASAKNHSSGQYTL